MPRKKKNRGRPSLLSRLSTADLLREFERRQSMRTQLEARRAQLERELSDLQSELSSLGAASAGGRTAAAPVATPTRRFRRGRGTNKMSLNATLHKVLQGRTLDAAGAMDAVRKAGYKSDSPNFRNMIAIAFSTNPKLFKRVSRGQYTAK